jgi:hypothetical protein
MQDFSSHMEQMHLLSTWDLNAFAHRVNYR